MAYLALVALVAGVLPALGLSGPASAVDGDQITETLEGCRASAGVYPEAGPYVCPDASYTTGQLGGGWNELDLVPHRLTVRRGAQSSTPIYKINVVADHEDGLVNGAPGTGKPGYDFISEPGVNLSKSHTSCTVVPGALLKKQPGIGGTDISMYRTLEITQNINTTCVLDYFERLALGSSRYPGASLHSNTSNENFTVGGVGARDVAIPVKEIKPQAITKDMTATQGSDHTWGVSKEPSPASLDFTDTCSPDAGSRQKNVDITVTWTKNAASPDGDVTVETFVYAVNPSHRIITVSGNDVIKSGGNTLATVPFGPTDVPANTANFLLLHDLRTVAAEDIVSNQLSDTATATYTDKVTNIPVPGSTTASDTATVQQSGPELNQTATITDTESITGDGLTFSVATPSVGSFTDGYAAGTKTTGPVNWTSGSQSTSGSVTFNKTVFVNQPRATTGSLSDTATLTGSDGFTTDASLSVGITSAAKVKIQITKTRTPVVNESQTFNFNVLDGANVVVGTAAITIPGGSTAQGSATVSNLAPGTYTVNELATAPYGAQSQTVTITLPSCQETVPFTNQLEPARARVQKVTVPAGSEAGWTFTLTGPDVANGSEALTTTGLGTGYFNFASGLATDGGVYTITETANSGFDLTNVAGDFGGTSGRVTTSVPNRTCSFTLDLPTDENKVLSCTFTNTQQGQIIVKKITEPAGSTQSFPFTLTGGPSTLNQSFNLVHGGSHQSGLVKPGSGYVAAEGAVDGWDLKSATCDDGSPVSNISLSAGETVTCTFTNTQKGSVTVIKTENGGVPTTGYTFRLTGGPDGVSISRTTDANNGGTLQFGLLKPGAYTLCELAVPAGTHSTLEDQGGTVNATSGDICLNFNLAAGEPKSFSIDNSRPGGDQRTIGYWRNWNSCSGTGADRVAMAARTGNHLADEFLHQTLGNFVVNTCAQAVDVLTHSSAKYAEHALAAQLLAAKLNIAAGASTCTLVNDAIAKADDLLIGISWDGSSTSKIVGNLHIKRAEFLSTADLLDRYNNGLIC